jgi:hypothetical protein
MVFLFFSLCIAEFVFSKQYLRYNKSVKKSLYFLKKQVNLRNISKKSTGKIQI